MTALVWTAYFLTVITAYHRVRAIFPTWQMRAELASIGVGYVVLAAVVVLVA